MIGSKNAQNGDFVAGLELGAAYAILPRLEWEFPTLDDVKTQSAKKIYNIGEGKDSVEFVLYGFGNQGFDQFAADTLGLGLLVNGEGTDFGGRGTVEMEGAAAQQLTIETDDGEIADSLGHFEFGAGEHDAAGGIAVDEVQNGCDIVHYGLADGEARYGVGGFHEGVGLQAANHWGTVGRRKRLPHSGC